MEDNIIDLRARRRNPTTSEMAFDRLLTAVMDCEDQVEAGLHFCAAFAGFLGGRGVELDTILARVRACHATKLAEWERER
ncbi:MAG TPA: hypothetical protein VNF04_04100 [Stellaceae bacterium]|nr:hypothetical protein [Stellaceae bacterium]